MATNTVIFNKPSDNFFIKCAASNAYEETQAGIKAASVPTKKKVYKDLRKMLEECYFVGSLKYGNNFIVQKFIL